MEVRGPPAGHFFGEIGGFFTIGLTSLFGGNVEVCS